MQHECEINVSVPSVISPESEMTVPSTQSGSMLSVPSICTESETSAQTLTEVDPAHLISDHVVEHENPASPNQGL